MANKREKSVDKYRDQIARSPMLTTLFFWLLDNYPPPKSFRSYDIDNYINLETHESNVVSGRIFVKAELAIRKPFYGPYVLVPNAEEYRKALQVANGVTTILGPSSLDLYLMHPDRPKKLKLPPPRTNYPDGPDLDDLY